MNELETIWIALLALISALSVYPLARKGSRFHWFGLLSMLLLFAMAVKTEHSIPTTQHSTVQPQFAGLDPVTSKYFEGLWLLMQERGIQDVYANRRRTEKSR